MFQLSVNEVVPAFIPLPIPATMNIGRGFVRDRDLADQQHLRSDLRLAMAVQRQMLPRRTKQLTTIRYAGTSAAARGIGGDYYDFLELAPGSLGFLLADVSGKGVAAALLMANLQAAIRCECPRGCGDLSAMLQSVNAHFFSSTLPEHYATLFFGQCDDRTRSLSYINCGQQPAIIIRGDRSIERLETTALPPGLVRHWTGEKETVELRRGDTLWVCSDGAIEAGLESGQELGEEGLISIITASSHRDMELAVAGIAHAVSAWAPNGPTDDMTIVGIRAV